MKDRRRVVFDANATVSAFLFPASVPGRLVFQSRRRIVPLMSNQLLGELVDVLGRPKLDSYVSPERRSALLAAFVSRCDFVKIGTAVEVCRDPRDNHILELALSGSADAVVTGDSDLLILDPFRGIRILRPAEFDGK
jgi:putative PIN family toxin of toxin-antitoxin system